MTSREIGISCNLLPAPPLGAQPINVSTLDESFATEETDNIQNEVEDPDESFQSTKSDDTDGSDLRNDRERKFLVYEGQLMDLWKLSIMCTTNIWGKSTDKGIIHHCHPGLWILRIPENLEQSTLHW